MMDSLESEDGREQKRKLEEMSEGKSTRPSDDAMFLRREIIDAITRSDENMETYSKKADEKMDNFDDTKEKYSKKTDEKLDKFLQTVNDSVGTQLHGMNTTIAKMKEDDDRYKQINERIANVEKNISDTDEKCENRSDEPRRAHDDQNQSKAVVTGFHSETSESEVEELMKETVTEMGVSVENARIECPAKPITSRMMTKETNTSDQRTC